MSDATVVLIVLGVGTFGLKSAGPLLLGDRQLPAALQRVVDLVPAALLAALAMSSTFGNGSSLTVDARAVGLAVAGIALWRRAPFVVVIMLAALATAVTRTLS
ncbi:MAG: AzlD domain-containing protein [Ilumatobacter sp.]